MKFHEATYWPSSEPKPFIDYHLRCIPGPCILEVAKWVREELWRAPVLIFVNEGIDARAIGGDIEYRVNLNRR